MPSRINNTGLSFGDIKANSKRRGQGFALKRDSRPAAVRRGLYYLLAIIHIEGPSKPVGAAGSWSSAIVAALPWARPVLPIIAGKGVAM